MLLIEELTELAAIDILLVRPHAHVLLKQVLVLLHVLACKTAASCSSMSILKRAGVESERCSDTHRSAWTPPSPCEPSPRSLSAALTRALKRAHEAVMLSSPVARTCTQTPQRVVSILAISIPTQPLEHSLLVAPKRKTGERTNDRDAPLACALFERRRDRAIRVSIQAGHRGCGARALSCCCNCDRASSVERRRQSSRVSLSECCCCSRRGTAGESRR